jgi:hypothetical protein
VVACDVRRVSVINVKSLLEAPSARGSGTRRRHQPPWTGAQREKEENLDLEEPVNAIKVETTVDEATASAIPALRPLLGKRVELIALQTEGGASEPAKQKLTLDELLARRVDAPPGTPPLSDEDIRRAIVEGALGGDV